MPVVRVESVGELTKEQKRELIKKITEIIVQVTGKPARAVYVRIEEVAGSDFGVGGEPLG
jgi:4-oxalocrotonate tautomerase family enzyme